jgi:hypothetical protein
MSWVRDHWHCAPTEQPSPSRDSIRLSTPRSADCVTNATCTRGCQPNDVTRALRISAETVFVRTSNGQWGKISPAQLSCLGQLSRL